MTAIKLEGADYYAQCIVDLHHSSTHSINRRKFLNPNGRVYSVSDKQGGKFKLRGHSSRVLLENCDFAVSENARQKIVNEGSKKPHAYVKGTVIQSDLSDSDHDALLNMEGAVFISYDPYKVKKFVVCPTAHLPQQDLCTDLKAIEKASMVYLFEDGCLAII